VIPPHLSAAAFPQPCTVEELEEFLIIHDATG
jgi:hypothetical protein